MSQKPNSSHVIGMDLEHSLLKGVQLSLKQGKPFIDKFFEIDLESKGAENELTKLRKDSQTNLFVTNLNTYEVLIRPLELKLKKDRDIDAILSFQMEPILPYPIEQAVIDRIVVKKSADGTELSVLAVRNDHLKAHLEKWESLEIEPEMVGSVPSSLVIFGQYFCESQDPYFIVNLHKEQITCVLACEGKLIAAQALSTGVNSNYIAWQNDVIEGERGIYELLSLDTVSESTSPNLSKNLVALRQELTRVLYALSKQIKGREVTSMLFVGEGVQSKGLVSFFNQTLEKELLTLTATYLKYTSADLQLNAVCLGAALSGLPKNDNAIDFRRGEFSYPHPWKRYQTAMMAYLLASVFFAVALYFGGNTYLTSQKDEAKRSYITLLNVMHKSYPAFEKEYNLKNPGNPNADENGVVPIQLLSIDDIDERLIYLDKELNSSTDSFPLQPNMPLVSDVLAWLNTHPNVVGKDEKSEALLPLLQIDNFNYVMVKRPEMKKKQEKYQIKVEIEFSSLTPKHAREFHDALIAPNEIVDPKGEVKWTTNRGKYRTSFYLKDRTVYNSSAAI